jgi:serine protease
MDRKHILYKLTFIFILVIAFICAMGLNSVQASHETYDFTIPADAPYVPDELLIRFEPKSNGQQRNPAEKTQILSSLGGGYIKHNFTIIPGLTQIKLPPGWAVKDALKIFNNKDGILHAQPNYLYHALSDPNDTRFSELWGMNNTGQSGGTADADIDAPEAWDIMHDACDVIVAVIDSGVDYTHPDIASNMWTDANGHHGYDYRNNDPDPMDDAGHGTHVAGIIGARGNNNLGVTGVCWNIKIMALKFLPASGEGGINRDSSLLLNTSPPNKASLYSLSS